MTVELFNAIVSKIDDLQAVKLANCLFKSDDGNIFETFNGYGVAQRIVNEPQDVLRDGTDSVSLRPVKGFMSNSQLLKAIQVCLKTVKCRKTTALLLVHDFCVLIRPLGR